MSGERRFPQSFLWGCATAAHHVEGGNHNCDWWEFQQRGGILTGDSADPACDTSCPDQSSRSLPTIR